ncbi:PREDICTED: TATA-binding protein-associated factor 172 isoform X2 [Amphimedon queenslandica]|uniref:TATA-binding protein-associated factor 172 n=1 Tax=Amphimedon queenslandica TaxID=400682 RepID=A0A1X7VTW2_AMPQE|nr:PREDICTED: TATA-binding protein-associated factor 172 isoform X2 [Amphimedon queenslandica]|eukprot:XP_019852330.1 PREDICTED: TATA-binding protein-associated factor 172 isoform X2 [Amphimedon queenslandica]
MATRLDRLWVLLECGSTPVTRKAAAQQIGEIQKLHPHEFNNLLRKVCQYLSSKNWDSRVAAAQAVEAIVKNVKHWNPPFNNKDEEKDAFKTSEQLSFETFDITQVLKYGTPLLSSTGDEYNQLENDVEYQKMTQKEKATYHRQQLKQKLGLVSQGKVFSTGLEQLFDDNDLLTNFKKQTKPLKQSNVEIHELTALSGMSARERNRAKRKVKMASRKVARDKEKAAECDNDPTPPTSKRLKTSSVMVDQAEGSNKIIIDQVPDTEAFFDESDEWPFTWFCEFMFQQLFNPQWEVRHGAGSALREVIKQHGDTAGILSTTPTEQRITVNQNWLSDAAIRIICVFALDRFADFVSDQVVAPVRATCAQVLGIICKELSDENIYKLINLLLILSQQDLWEIRHSTLLGLQHLLAARMDVSINILPVVGECIIKGLQDNDDDVRSVAARALLPVADHLHTSFNDRLVMLVHILWDSLLHLDDLSSSTAAVMDLLSCLLTYLPKYKSNNEEVSSLLSGSSLSLLVPRLYPFLNHTIHTVRGSCLKTINNLIMIPNEGATPNKETSLWLEAILNELLNNLFIRLALEGDSGVGNVAFEVWNRVVSLVDGSKLCEILSKTLMNWLSILVTPPIQSIDLSLLNGLAGDVYLGGCLGVESISVKEQAAFKARVTCSKCIGLLVGSIPSSSHALLSTPVSQMLSSNSSICKILASLLITYWKDAPPQPDIITSLTSSLTEYCVYEEVTPFMASLQKDCYVLVSGLEKKGIDVSGGINPSLYSVEFAVQLAGSTYSKGIETLTLTDEEKQDFESYHRNLLTSIGQYQEYHSSLQLLVQTTAAGSLISLSSLPPKLNPIIRPLMDSIKTHSDPLLQSLTSQWLSVLLELSIDRTPSPNNKIIKNLAGYLCCDSSHTPPIKPADGTGQEQSTHTHQKKDSSNSISWSITDGIISLMKNNKVSKSLKSRRGPGRPAGSNREANGSSGLTGSNNEQNLLSVQRSGGEAGLSALVGHFGSELFTKLPQLWSLINDPLSNIRNESKVFTDDDMKAAAAIVNGLQIFETLCPAILDSTIKERFFSLLPSLLSCVLSPFTAIRHMGARCTAALAIINIHEVLMFFMDEILPFLGDTKNIENRQGAIEVIACFIDTLDINILWYVVLLVMPVLGRMSDQDNSVRLMASHCFAKLVALMPLESGAVDPAGVSQVLVDKRNKERKFLEQLLNPSKLDNYKVPVPIKAELRKYQQDGINWLAFLNKYQVHGILCDDMGLGKTLQSICIIAGDTFDRKKQYEATGHPDCSPLPSIVICPPTLTGHWYYEVKKFCELEHLNPIQYCGPPAVRGRLQKVVSDYDLVIVSYDIVRNDIDFFSGIHWNYCVLDEGHIIKNTKTKVTKAVKSLLANHRLILSGTPIQNNVLELWSLFDFLMPGFLGTEQHFNIRYGHPIVLSRDAKSSSKEQEAGALAMEALHRQVLPFLLRRMKEDVLQDLPPKIIQDYHCDLSPLQVLLYEDFAQSRAKQNVEDTVYEGTAGADDSEPPEKKKKKSNPAQGHVFQALQYLRKVCNHPLLVVNKDHPLYDNVMKFLNKDNTTLHDITHSAKLLALKQLLNECGIGTNDVDSLSDACIDGGGSVVSQHRVLLFCQYKTILDIIERDLLKVHMPSVTYLRLDGSVPPKDRHDLVHRFNMDPSIDLLLLTTHVGGLGLNLTGADTVIFFEHDWNPTKDLQAMDRAHRIGQKRVVNVYRLITRGTLEEKIMSLQKFKLNIANTVVTQENNSLLSMNTSDFLDLFQLGEGKGAASSSTAPSTGGSLEAGIGGIGGGGLKSILDNLPDLWDDNQYDTEYNIENFMNSLKTDQ